MAQNHSDGVKAVLDSIELGLQDGIFRDGPWPPNNIIDGITEIKAALDKAATIAQQVTLKRQCSSCERREECPFEDDGCYGYEPGEADNG